VNNDLGFDLYFARESLKTVLVMSLFSVLVLVGVFHYLNRYTKRQYFAIWTAAWLFYALWLMLCLTLQSKAPDPFFVMLKQWCVGASAIFLLWGNARFLGQRSSQVQFGLFMTYLFVWSYIGAYHLEGTLQVQLPIFGLIGLASIVTAWCFLQLRGMQHYLGSSLLAAGFFGWGLYLIANPFLQNSEDLVTAGHVIATVLQLFIAVGMIVLVLEEVRTSNQQALQKIQRQQMEAELLQRKMESTEERYRSLFDQASEGIVITAAGDLRILEMNQTAQRYLGTSLVEDVPLLLSSFCEMSALPTLPSTGAEWFELICQRRLLHLVRKDGSRIFVEVDGALVNFEGRDACQFFFREQTERAHLEQQLRQAEKLSALGQMISGVAHELNNPLAVVKGYLELILARHELGAQTRIDLEKVAHESNRAAKLVGNFLSFARQQPVHRQNVEVNELIRRVVELRKFELLVAGVNIQLDLAGSLPPITGDPDQIQQVLINLMGNAVHALADQAPPRVLTIRTRREGLVVQVLVEDNGPGVPENFLSHIFEPFFTTKEVGTGTGLGLSIAHGIMTDHQGRLFYQPPSTGGAGFVMEFPIGAQPELALATPPPGPLPEKSVLEQPLLEPSAAVDPPVSARILVLDDEKSIAELVGEFLQALGHQPTLCHSASQALELLEESDFDLIISDFRMPVMDGRGFYEALFKQKPALARRIIFLTGDVVNEDTLAFLRSIGNPYFAKPFQLGTVEQAVAQGLREKSATDATAVAAAPAPAGNQPSAAPL
jgi:signal transduction histidine kinase/CheY-like chemotaxis protein